MPQLPAVPASMRVIDRRSLMLRVSQTLTRPSPLPGTLGGGTHRTPCTSATERLCSNAICGPIILARWVKRTSMQYDGKGGDTRGSLVLNGGGRARELRCKPQRIRSQKAYAAEPSLAVNFGCMRKGCWRKPGTDAQHTLRRLMKSARWRMRLRYTERRIRFDAEIRIRRRSGAVGSARPRAGEIPQGRFS